MKIRFRVADVEKMGQIRPAGYVEDVLDHGEVVGEFFYIDFEPLQKLRAKYSQNVTPRTFPVPPAEAERCRLICEQCPGRLYLPEITFCNDPACGCILSTDRREPWLNRKSRCRFWEH